MLIPETENCYSGFVSVHDGVMSPEINIVVTDTDVPFVLALDQEQAALLVPVLQHFVETGEMP